MYITIFLSFTSCNIKTITKCNSQVPKIKEVFSVILEQTMVPKNVRWQYHIVQDVLVVQKGESPFAVLKLAFLYNGEKFIEDLDDLTVSFQ